MSSPEPIFSWSRGLLQIKPSGSGDEYGQIIEHSSTFSSPEPPGGLSTKTRTLWGHRIWSPRFKDLRSFLIFYNVSNSVHLTYRSVNDFRFSWFKAFKRQSSKLLSNRKWPEVLKSRTSNPVSPEPPGPRAQAPRRLCGLWSNILDHFGSHGCEPFAQRRAD